MPDLLDEVAGAARATMAGSCVAGGLTVGGLASYAAEFVLDPVAGRCAFSEPLDLVIDGDVEYEAVSSGRWACRNLVPGRWLMLDPRYGLALLLDGCTAAEPGVTTTGARSFRLEFDLARAAALSDVGLASRWVRASGRATIDFRGRIGAMTISFGDGTDTLALSWRMRWFGPPIAISLPPDRLIIAREDYLREAEEGRHE